MNEDDNLQEQIEHSLNNGIAWHKRVLLKFWPKLAFKFFARDLGIQNPVFDKLHETFAEVEKVDLILLTTGRGFMLILDGKTSLWFFQEGDHFKYDGFEMGEYEKGDVTIFDKIKN